MNTLKESVMEYFRVDENGQSLDVQKSVDENGVEVQKDYVAPNLNNDILNQRHGRLLIDKGAGYLDLVVSQSEFLSKIDFQKVDASDCDITVYDNEAKIIQVANGVNPFDTDANLSTYFELGYNLVLQSMQLCYKITDEQMRSMQQIKGWTNILSSQMSKAFSNELMKVALTATPSSGDDTLKNGYNWITGSTYKGKPYIGMTGLLYHMKHGYTYDKDGSPVTVTPASTKNAYDISGSKFKSLMNLMDEMLIDYPSEFMVESEVKYFMSIADKIKYRIERRNLNEFNGTTSEKAIADNHSGIEIVAVPFLKSLQTKVTVSGTDYYPGMMWLGRWNDLKIRANMAMVTEKYHHDVMKREYQMMYETQMNFGTIPQRIVVATVALS